MDFFLALESVLFCKDIDSRYALFRDLYEDFLSQKTTLNHSQIINKDFVSFSPCKLTEPTKIHRSKSIKSKESLGKTLHSIAHIEFCAISLALDSAYRFRHLPRSYYEDWLGVANEEFGHFFLLRDLLGEIGFGYGDFTSHFGLYEAMSATGENLIYRMGVVHRGLEAKGLDANPFVLEKLQQSDFGGDRFCGGFMSEVERVFGIILHDEIAHVSKGSKWWKFAQKQDKIKESGDKNDLSRKSCGDFIEICEKFSGFVLAGKILNIQARLESGFSKEECERIDRFYKDRFSKHSVDFAET